MGLNEGSDLYFVSFAAGISLHHLLFRHGEWDLYGMRIFLCFGLFNIIFTLCMVYTSTSPINLNSVLSVFFRDAKVGSALLLGLTSSMLTYRAFFHRLKHFPGPWQAKLSNWYFTSLIFKKLQQFQEVDKLHRQYGDFVRVGPSELSITHPAAAAIIHAPNSPCIKGPWYLAIPRKHIQATRDKAEHAQRRRVWDHGFSVRALREYEPRMADDVGELMQRFEEFAGDRKTVNVTDYYNYFAFDFMGGLAFGEGFGQLREGKEGRFLKTFHEQAVGAGLFSHAVWLGPFLTSIPGLDKDFQDFWGWVDSLIQKRWGSTPRYPDVFQWIKKDYEDNGREFPVDLTAEAAIIVMAGSDTVAAMLTYSTMHLASNSRVMEKLQAEMDEYVAGEGNDLKFEAVSMTKLPYLNAVINEVLRMHPPVPAGLQRKTPAEGLWIEDVFVPGDTIVQVPMNSVHRDSRSFSKSNEFIPERWTDQREELIHDLSSYMPFSHGIYQCIGKQLGLQLLRRVIGSLVWRFDVTLVEGQTAENFEEGARDMFSLIAAPLMLSLSPRKE